MNRLLLFTISVAVIPLASLNMDIGSNQYILRRAWSCQNGPNYTTLTFHDIVFDYSNSNFESRPLVDNNRYYSAYLARSLAIVNSSIATIPPSFFIRHSAMYECWLVNINISKIIPGAFMTLDKLICLNMSRNKIEYVQEGIFNGLHSLRSLDLSQNKINNISEHAFLGLTSLEVLYLQENKIISLHDNLFLSQADSMKLLNISSNKLKEVHSTFTSMRLDTLHLSDNEIDNISFNVSVKILHLEGNKITYVNDYAFANSSLRKLYLSHNNISQVHKESFFALFNLTHISLDHNNLSSLPNTCFKDLNTLEYLDLSHNAISNLQYGIFDNIKNLKCINISYNSFSYLNEDIFSHLQSLEQIVINNNNIQNIDIIKLQNYCPLLKIMALDGNVWKCDILTKIITNLKKFRYSVEVVRGRSFDSENVRGISCKSDVYETTPVYYPNSLHNVTTVSSYIERRNLPNSVLTKFFNDDFRNTSMYDYFNGGFQKSSFFKYLENMKIPHVIEKSDNLNESNTQGLFRSVNVEKSNASAGYSGITVILIVIAIALITIVVLKVYTICKYRRNSAFECVELT